MVRIEVEISRSRVWVNYTYLRQVVADSVHSRDKVGVTPKWVVVDRDGVRLNRLPCRNEALVTHTQVVVSRSSTLVSPYE